MHSSLPTYSVRVDVNRHVGVSLIYFDGDLNIVRLSQLTRAATAVQFTTTHLLFIAMRDFTPRVSDPAPQLSARRRLCVYSNTVSEDQLAAKISGDC